MASVKDMGTYKFNYSDCRKISEEDYNKLVKSGCSPKNDDILIAKDGSPLSNIFIYKEEYPIVLLSSIAIIRPNKSKILPEFLKYYLENHSIKRYIQTTYTSGSVIPRIILKDFKKFPIIYPNLENQKKIIGILRTIDKKIAINEEINRNLYEILINNFNVIFDHEDKDCKLSDIVNIRRGASPRPIKDYISDTGINWLKIADVTGTEMPFIYKIKEKIIEEGKSKSVFIKKGTLVVSNSATPGIPKFIMVDTCVHDGWLVLNGYEDNLRYYLYFLIVKIRKELINLAYGSVFNNLKTDTLKNYEISKPKDDQLDRFNKIAKPIMEKIDSNTKEIMMLSKLRDTLLPKLMSGEIDVSKINCDSN